MRLERLAPAKINLFLHVGPLQADGYHPVASLMTFADVGDRVRFRPAPEMSFALEGPFAAELGVGRRRRGNLQVVRARDAMLAAFPVDWAPFCIATVEKNLPVAAGLGGGSSDAATTLTLLADALASTDYSEDANDRMQAIASRLGSDVTACLGGQPVMATGRGDECDWPPVFPDLDVVLVNPLVASPTGAVYRAYDDAGAPGDAELPLSAGSAADPAGAGRLPVGDRATRPRQGPGDRPPWRHRPSATCCRR